MVSSPFTSGRRPAIAIAAVELGEIAGPHPIALAELNKLPPLPYLSLNAIPKQMLDHALSVRRFGVVPARKEGGFFVISHLRFFTRLEITGRPKTKIRIEIISGLNAEAIRKHVRADIYEAALVDAVPIPALSAIAEELEAGFPWYPGHGKTSGGKVAVARYFGVDVRRFRKQSKAEKEETVHFQETSE